MRIAFWGNFGTLNLGNECTLAAAVCNIRNRLPEAGLIAICCEPADTASRHGIGAVPMSERRVVAGGGRGPKAWRILGHIVREAGAWARAFRHASSIDMLLITGCGILSDQGEGTLGLPYELFKWSLVTKLRGKKLLFISVGAESISRPLSRALLKAALRLADYRGYRDTHSAKLLQSLGFRTDHDVVCPDLAFSLPRYGAAIGSPVTIERGGLRRRAVAIGLYNYRGRGEGSPDNAAAYHSYLDRLGSLILWLQAHDYLVRVIIGDFAYDEEVRLDLRAALARRGMVLTEPGFSDEPAVSFEQLLDQLSTIDFVIASRYHNVILALLLAIPVVSLSYEGKNEAVMSDLGLGDYCQTLDDFSVERLLQQFQRLESNSDSLRVMIAERGAANRARLEQQYDLILGMVGGVANQSPSR
jgi:polysaccharide pyruvyl transferase WcaK-like protein